MVRKARMRLKKREIGPEPNHFCAALNPIRRPRTTGGAGRSTFNSALGGSNRNAEEMALSP